MPVHTVSYTVEWQPGGVGTSWIDITSYVLSVSGDAATSGSSETPLAFDSAAEARLSVVVLDTLSGAWERTPIRYSVTIDATTARAFVGLVTNRRRSSTGEMTMECSGASAFPQSTKSYSPLFSLRPLFTKTTVS